MSNSITIAPNQAVRKATKEERRKQRQRQFIAMVSIVFVILFVFSMCVTVIAASIGAVDASNGENETISTPDSGKPGIVHLSTYDEAETQKETAENTTDATESTTENTTEAETEATEPVTEETTEPTEEVKNYTEDDLFYLAAAVCREAGGESEEIQLLVANVIINRVNSSLYPDTIYEVLTQYKQYGTMWKYGVSFPDWADEKVKEQCYSVAQRILEGERYCPENVLFQAEFKQGSGVYKQFGDDYYFCYYG